MSSGDHHGSSNVGLPEDIIISELLVRLPVKSLVRFRCVSKSWQSIISNPRFIQSHMQKQAKKKKVLIAPLRTFGGGSPPLDFGLTLYAYDDGSMTASLCIAEQLPFLPFFSVRPQHANGLVLFNYGILYVCNPSTRQCRRLPECTRDARYWQYTTDVGMQMAGLGFVRSTNTYKVVNYFYRSFDPVSGTWSLGSEVFTLGGGVDSRWRATKVDPPYPIVLMPLVVVGDFVYSRIDKSLHTSSPERFFSFSLKDETFRIVQIPCEYYYDPGNRHYMDFLELEGETFFMRLSQSGTKLDLWINKDPATMDVWIHTFSINFHEPAFAVDPVAIHHGKILLLKRNGYVKLVYYNLQNGLFEKEVDLRKLYYIDPQSHQNHRIFNEPRSEFFAISCMDTLVPVNVRRSA